MKHQLKAKPQPKTARRQRPFLLLEVIIWALALGLTGAATFSWNTRPGNFIQVNLQPLPTPMQNLQSLLQSHPPAKPTPQPTSAPPLITGYTLQVPILMYHYIGNNPNPADKARYALSVTPDKFGEQMKYIKENGYQTISLDTLYSYLSLKKPLPSKMIILTFDDGYIDFYYNAFPILQQYGFSATEFIITGFVGKSAYLTWDQIRKMESSHLIDFEAHTIDHPFLPTLPAASVEKELKESKQTLEKELGVPVNFLAYPYGATNHFVEQEVHQAGFMGAVGTWYGKTQALSIIYDMPRIRVSNSFDMQTFAGLL